jgi:hypothetical protein
VELDSRIAILARRTLWEVGGGANRTDCTGYTTCRVADWRKLSTSVEIFIATWCDAQAG